MNGDYQLNKVQKTIEQELAFSCPELTTDEWLRALSLRINEMILHEFPRLVEILYRLDIEETKLALLLKGSPATDAGDIIGKILIKRQLEKIQSRDAYRQSDIDINNDEKW